MIAAFAAVASIAIVAAVFHARRPAHAVLAGNCTVAERRVEPSSSSDGRKVALEITCDDE